MLSLIGFIKYRGFIYELFFKNYYQYRKYDEAIVGEEYQKKIPFIKEDIVKAYDLWNKVKNNTIAELKSSKPKK